MPYVYDARSIMEGALYDARRLLDKGEVRTAFNVLKRKVREIEKKEACVYQKVRWE